MTSHTRARTHTVTAETVKSLWFSPHEHCSHCLPPESFKTPNFCNYSSYTLLSQYKLLFWTNVLCVLRSVTKLIRYGYFSKYCIGKAWIKHTSSFFFTLFLCLTHFLTLYFVTRRHLTTVRILTLPSELIPKQITSKTATTKNFYVTLISF